MAGSAQKEEREFHEPDADDLLRRAAREQADGNLADAELLLREAVLATERATEPGGEALIGTLGALGKLLVARGAVDDARSVFTRALHLADQHPDANESDQLLLLNELSRLHLKQAAYAPAEPLLRRLLAMKQQQGEERPEVATVLATLAAVRKVLGDHVASEELFRRALAIRESTLPPNHITTAATMESLSEACAARGHFAEAVSLSTRALTMRELTLGRSDASVRAARERIADLLLQGPEGSGAMPPLRSTPSSQPAQPAPSPLRASNPPRDSQYGTPLDWQPPEERLRSPASSHQTVALVPWADELMAVQRENAIGATSVRAITRSQPAAGLETRSKSPVVATVVMVAVLGGIAIASHVSGNAGPTFVDVSPPIAASRAGFVVAPAGGPSSPLRGNANAAEVNTSVSAAFAAAVASRGTSGDRSGLAGEPVSAVPARETVAQPPQLPRGILPSISVPDIAVPMRLESVPARSFTDSFPDRTSVLGRGTTPRGGGGSDGAPTAPRLLGAAPQPKYPEVLRRQRIEGEVLVQFVVDEKGQPDVATLRVVRSPHDQLTNAVRAVLTQFRFETARTAGPDSRPRAATVEVGFTFRAQPR